MSISDTDLTTDAFLGGRLTLVQPARGYRAGVDPVILAAHVPARPGQSVLDLGCGVGCALFCLGRRVGDLTLAGVEIQSDYAALARRNAEENGLSAQIFTGDIAALPAELRQQRFDHVLTNPPYYAAASGTVPRAADRATAHREDLPLDDWIAAGARRLLPRGTMTVIQRADRLADLLGAMDRHLGSLELLCLHPRPGRDASLVLLRGIKGGRGPLRIRDAITMHQDATEGCSGESYAPRIEAVLRDAQKLG